MNKNCLFLIFAAPARNLILIAATLMGLFPVEAAKRKEPEKIPDKLLKQGAHEVNAPEQIYAFLKDTRPDFVKAFPEIPADIKKINADNRAKFVKNRQESKVRQKEWREKERARIKAEDAKKLKEWTARQKKRKDDSLDDSMEYDPKPTPTPPPLEYGHFDYEFEDEPEWHCQTHEIYDEKDKLLMSGLKITAIKNFRKLEGTRMQQKKNFRNKWIDTPVKHIYYRADVIWGTPEKPAAITQSVACGHPSLVPRWIIYDPDPPRDNYPTGGVYDN